MFERFTTIRRRATALRPAVLFLIAAATATAAGLALTACTAAPDGPDGQAAESASEADCAAADTAASAADSGEAAVYDKTEVVYSTLDANGSPTATYVVNQFDVDEPGTVTDHGAYDAVTNLTDGTALACTGETVEFSAPAGTFYYQGDMPDARLPWTVDIAYTLDGSPVSADELGGSAGNLEMTVSTSRNENQENSAFYDSFMLQMTITIPTSKISSLACDGSVIASAGANTVVTCTVLPGRDATFTLTGHVDDFSMAGIQIAALPSAQMVDAPDAGELTGGMTALSEAVARLSYGAASLAYGTDELADGSRAFGGGLAELSASGPALVNGSQQMKTALDGLAAALDGFDPDALEGLSSLPGVLRSAADSLDSAASSAEGLSSSYGEACASLGRSIDALRNLPAVSDGEIAQLESDVAGTPAESTAAALAQSYRSARDTVAAYDRALPALEEAGRVIDLMGNAETAAQAHATADTMRALADELEESGPDLAEQVAQAVEGLRAFADRYASFHDGLAAYVDGVTDLAAGYPDLHGGIAGTHEGVQALSGGLALLNAQTAELPEAMRSSVESMAAEYAFPEFDPASFVSSDNEHVSSVQFVMTTAPITVPAAPAPDEGDASDEGILDRLMALFS